MFVTSSCFGLYLKGQKHDVVGIAAVCYLLVRLTICKTEFIAQLIELSSLILAK